MRIGTTWTTFAVCCGATLTCLFGEAARAQSADQQARMDQSRVDGESAHWSICVLYGCNNGSGGGGLHLGVDPCFLAQNAMRPCNSTPVGVDPNIVGTWELPLKGGHWVLEIRHDGTYKFHSEARDGVPSSGGQFSASNGQWSLKTTGYTDGGNYLFQAPDTWIVTGKLGAAAWRHPASVHDTMRDCITEQHPPSKTAGVDPNVIGVWELPLKGGLWVLEILRDGTYKFHSDAGDGAPSHTGKFSASNGQWSLTATTGYTDSGLYLYQAPDIWIATGHLGAAAWRRPVSKADSCR
jgi:hypothetical protein